MRVIQTIITQPIFKGESISDEEFNKTILERVERMVKSYEYDSICLEDVGLREDQIKALTGGLYTTLIGEDKYYTTEFDKRDWVTRNYKVYVIRLLEK